MVILILGVSKGIGLETAKYLLADHQVIGISRNPLSFSHPHLHYIQGDIKDTATLETCVQYLKNNNLSIDVMINNAGILIYQAFEHITPSELNETFHTNVLAPFIWIQNMLPYLKKSKVAHIVNISSMGGITGTQKFAGLSAYSSSKGALSILTECLAEELKGYSVKCNALALGAVQTEMFSNAFPEMKAPLTAAEMAQFIGWFAVNGHLFFNGKILPVATSTP